jgi:hypothetical protein
MKTSGRIHSDLEPFLETIKQLPFVREVRFDAPEQGKQASARQDAILTIVGPEKRRFEYSAEIKRSYLDRSLANAVIARAQRASEERDRPVLLLARYVPSPTGERLIDAGVNFVDLAGNMHLALGTRYGRTMLGKSEEKRSREHLSMTGAQMQLLFLFATYPEAGSWPVREIAAKAGVSKSKAAEVRRHIIETGVFERHPDGSRFSLSRRGEEVLLTGYSQILRPKLVVGRFQSAFRDADEFVAHLSSVSRGGLPRFALTGGPAANALKPYYRGPQTPLFAADTSPETRRLLRLLPDREGPITLLKAFGDLVFWRELDSLTVAPPWLIYAELMQSSDPRAHEAAEEFRRGFLGP